jgi:SAM-dependent methyltransferase
VPSAPPPGRYEWLDFNSPMSDALADAIAAALARTAPALVLDIGCGWGELLLRVLAAAPAAHGIGVDRDEVALARARTNASERGLATRVTFSESMPDPAEIAPPTVVLCVGADHVFGEQRDALGALANIATPGGRLLFGTAFWERPPTVEEAAGLGATPDDFVSLPDLVDLAMSAGFRLLDLRTATRREWEQFEMGFLADWEEWLMRWPNAPGAADIRERADAHRDGYLRGYREVLGFAYLTLGLPAR